MARLREALLDPVFNNNPIALQVLGICSALAVTTRLETTFTMCLSVIFVTAFSNLAVSMIRNHIPTIAGGDKSPRLIAAVSLCQFRQQPVLYSRIFFLRPHQTGVCDTDISLIPVEDRKFAAQHQVG